MKHLQLLSLIGCVSLFVSCETTDMAVQGDQQASRPVAEQQAQTHSQLDESDQNLRSVQEDRLNRDTNPAIRY